MKKKGQKKKALSKSANLNKPICIPLTIDGKRIVEIICRQKNLD